MGVKPNIWQTVLLQRDLDGGFFLYVFFSLSRPTARSQLQRVVRHLPWGAHAHSDTRLGGHLHHKQFIWCVLQEKVTGKKKSLISSLFLGSSNVQEKYFIPTQDAKGQWNLWEAPPTYHTESRAAQAFVGIPVTVTGQAFSRLGKKEPSATCLKQTQQKYFHYWNDPFWSIFSEKNKRIWLWNSLTISLQNILKDLYYHSGIGDVYSIFFCYTFFLSSFTLLEIRNSFNSVPSL